MPKKKPWTLYVLLALILFQGFGGIGGGVALVIKPDGSLLQMPATALHGAFFGNYLLPGLILFLILGALPVFIFSILIARPEWHIMQVLNIYKNRYPGWTLSLFLGLGLIIWMDVEVAVIGYGAFIQSFFSALGLLIVIFTLMPGVMKYYERE
jgi:hypothetical protein